MEAVSRRLDRHDATKIDEFCEDVHGPLQVMRNTDHPMTLLSLRGHLRTEPGETITLADGARLVISRAAPRDEDEFTALVSGENHSMQGLLGHQGAPLRTTTVRGGVSEYEVEPGSHGIRGHLEDLLRAAAAGSCR
jgi:hypothetical protein